MKTSHLLHRSAKNSKFVYYTKNIMRYLTPCSLLRNRLQAVLSEVEKREDKEVIYNRVNYYNKLNKKVQLPEQAKGIGEHRLRGNKSVYFFDTYEYTRWFPRHLKWCYIFGDVNFIAQHPSIVKSRPIGENNQHSILLNLNKVRHFCFLKDRKAFGSKMDKVIFRGEAHGKPRRQLFIDMYMQHPLCDVGDVSNNPPNPQAKEMTRHEHLNYKFIMALEGNDVASNLKWVMSSNSIAVMPHPICETWFMEGRLIPNYHYIEIKSDYSDLIEQVNYYIHHPDEAQRIIDHAHEYIAQFQDKKREKLIALLVLKKYFQFTNE